MDRLSSRQRVAASTSPSAQASSPAPPPPQPPHPFSAPGLHHERRRSPPLPLHLHQQTRIQQRRHCVQDRNGSTVRWPMGVSPDLGRLHCPASDEDREPPEDLLLLVL